MTQFGQSDWLYTVHNKINFVTFLNISIRENNHFFPMYATVFELSEYLLTTGLCKGHCHFKGNRNSKISLKSVKCFLSVNKDSYQELKHCLHSNLS